MPKTALRVPATFGVRVAAWLCPNSCTAGPSNVTRKVSFLLVRLRGAKGDARSLIFEQHVSVHYRKALNRFSFLQLGGFSSCYEENSFIEGGRRARAEPVPLGWLAVGTAALCICGLSVPGQRHETAPHRTLLPRPLPAES